MKPILQAVNAVFHGSIRYPQIEIRAGKATFIKGPSGCGKSTLLRLFNESLSLDSGEILYQGKNTADMDTIWLRREIQLVGQAAYLFPGTIRDNFFEYYRCREQEPPGEEQMTELLSLCCVDFPLNALCDTMSGGERQRVFVAVCMSFQPKVLLLDEPTSALDPVTADQMVRQIKGFCLKNEITLLVVSHDALLANKFADDRICLEGVDGSAGHH